MVTLSSLPVKTTVTTNIIDSLEPNLTSILSLSGCKNVRPEPAPLLNTQEEFAQFTQYFTDLSISPLQPTHEVWFFDRFRISVETAILSTSTKHQQRHFIGISGLIWDRTYEQSYQKLQERVQKMMFYLEKNFNLLYGSDAEQIFDLDTRFSFRRFGETFFHRADTLLQLLVSISESRSFQ